MMHSLGQVLLNVSKPALCSALAAAANPCLPALFYRQRQLNSLKQWFARETGNDAQPTK